MPLTAPVMLCRPKAVRGPSVGATVQGSGRDRAPTCPIHCPQAQSLCCERGACQTVFACIAHWSGSAGLATLPRHAGHTVVRDLTVHRTKNRPGGRRSADPTGAGGDQPVFCRGELRRMARPSAGRGSDVASMRLRSPDAPPPVHRASSRRRDRNAGSCGSDRRTLRRRRRRQEATLMRCGRAPRATGAAADRHGAAGP